MNRPFPQWHRSVRVLQEVAAWHQSAVPIVVTGNDTINSDESDPLWRCCQSLGRNLQKFPQIVLVTRPNDAVGYEAAYEFYLRCHEGKRLINVDWERHDSFENYDVAPGKLLFTGKSIEDVDYILGMSTQLTIVAGGGCHATHVANATLASGGLVIPIASTGGAAAGLHCEICDSAQCQIDIGLATQRAKQAGLWFDERWTRLRCPKVTPETAVRILCQSIFELSG